LRPRQRAAEAIWLGLRRRDGVDFAAIGARLDVDVEDAFGAIRNRQAAAGDVVRDGDVVRLSASGLLFADRLSGDYLGAGLPG
jgi:coproporphyrinogen III oxidase-like Fe-S oxidoreductase